MLSFLHSRRILLIAAVLAATLALVSCGNKSPYGDYKIINPNDIETKQLQVGADFLSAPNNWMTFYVLKKGQRRFGYLTFTPSDDGRLTVSKGSVGVGQSCVGSNGKNDYELKYTYWAKSPNSSQFDEPISPARGFFGDDAVQDQLSLKGGQDFRIQVELNSFVNCQEAQIAVLATFDHEPTY